MEEIAAAMQVLFMCLQAYIAIQERKMILLHTTRMCSNRQQRRLHARRQVSLIDNNECRMLAFNCASLTVG